DQVISSVARYCYYPPGEPRTELVQPNMPLLVDPRVIVRIVPSHDSLAGARQKTSQQADYRRFKQMGVKNVNLLAAQVSRQANDGKWIFRPAPAVAAKASDAFRFHILSKPRRHGVERSEIHPVPRAVVPPGKLREESARVAILREVQKMLPIVFFHLNEDMRARRCLLLYLLVRVGHHERRPNGIKNECDTSARIPGFYSEDSRGI